MGFRFRRSFSLIPGVRLNVSKSGVSTSVGRRGLFFTMGPRGTRTTVGIPGTGLSYTEQSAASPPRQVDGKPPQPIEPLDPGDRADWPMRIVLTLAAICLIVAGLLTFVRL